MDKCPSAEDYLANLNSQDVQLTDTNFAGLFGRYITSLILAVPANSSRADLMESVLSKAHYIHWDFKYKMTVNPQARWAAQDREMHLHVKTADDVDIKVTFDVELSWINSFILAVYDLTDNLYLTHYSECKLTDILAITELYSVILSDTMVVDAGGIVNDTAIHAARMPGFSAVANGRIIAPWNVVSLDNPNRDLAGEFSEVYSAIHSQLQELSGDLENLPRGGLTNELARDKVFLLMPYLRELEKVDRRFLNTEGQNPRCLELNTTSPSYAYEQVVGVKIASLPTLTIRVQAYSVEPNREVEVTFEALGGFDSDREGSREFTFTFPVVDDEFESLFIHTD